MKIKNLLLLFLILPITSFAQDKQTIIANVNVFDGEKFFEKTNLIFQNGKIIDNTKEPTNTSGSELIDGSNKTIIPPLLNAHVHVWMRDNLKNALKYGIFALLDMHITDKLANDLRAFNDSLSYAEYYSSNAGATVPGGHGTQYGIAVPTINDSVSASQFVKDRLLSNADYIKILKEPLRPTLTTAQTLKVIEETHKNNKIAVALRF